MFDFVNEKKRVVQIVLALIILPFALWGVDSYRHSGDASLATVNDYQVGQAEFEDAMDQQRQRLREVAGENFDPALFDRPEIKRSILEGVVLQHVLQDEAAKVGLVVSDAQMAQIIAGIPAFQTDGNFDKKRYEAALRAQGMTTAVFEYRVRRDLLNRELTDAYAQNGFASGEVADRLIRLNEQQRVVSLTAFGLDAFLKQVQVADADVKAYYDRNASQFEMAERAQIDYVVFSANQLAEDIKPTAAEVEGYFSEHQSEFSTQEQRRAAHILITVAPKASAEEKQAAKAKAEDLLRQVKASPERFAALAKQYSQDPGSAANGGDLGMFGRGAMVKQFDEAVFALKVGQISDLVETDYGYHIIKLTAIEPVKVEPLSQVRTMIEDRLREQQAADRFAELAEKFSNAVYEQSDSLQPAAELVGAKIVHGTWLSRDQKPQGLWSEKVLQAVFADDAVKDQRNTAAIEVQPNTLLAARVTSHQPASLRPYAEVASGIRQLLQRERAVQAAEAAGKDQLAGLQAGKVERLVWKSGVQLSRAQRSDLDPALLRQIFNADVSKLPAYVGMADAQRGYVIARIDAVKDVQDIDAAKRGRYLEQMRKVAGEALLAAYLEDAKTRADITLKPFAAEEAK